MTASTPVCTNRCSHTFCHACKQNTQLLLTTGMQAYRRWKAACHREQATQDEQVGASWRKWGE